jgi:hypothetical protein
MLVGIATGKARGHPRERLYERNAIDMNHGMATSEE